MEQRIGIVGWGSSSPLGGRRPEIWSAYRHPATLIAHRHDLDAPGAGLSLAEEEALQRVSAADKRYRHLDRSVLLAMLAAERATAGWPGEPDWGVNIGSSRGATALWESHHTQSLTAGSRHLHPLSSPTTTLGNLSSWVGHHLGGSRVSFSHSITCSTAFHALLNGLVWIESGRTDSFLVGGAEAPLTPFTVAQMQALRIYAGARDEPFPCRAGDLRKKHNGMVLGEGAACFLLRRAPEDPLAWIAGVGYGSEPLETASGLSKDGLCLQRSMRMALEAAGAPEVDAVVTHSPGTVAGDAAELEAIRIVFGGATPVLTNNKWKIGHTLGASAALSLEFALLMLLERHLLSPPYLAPAPEMHPRRIMVNALGFGGNAVSVILSAGK